MRPAPRLKIDVKAFHMSWSGQGPGGRRGYHHGNLREALIQAALDLIAKKGPAGFTFADAARSAGVSAAAPYRHFRDRDALIADVARRGFELFAARLSDAWNDGRPDPFTAFENVGLAYLAFALRHPALYAAMFILPTNLRFGEAETRPELRAGFEAIAAVVSPFCADVEVVTETFWAALHGLAELERSGRIRPGKRDERIALVVRAIVGSGKSARGQG